MEYPHTWTQQPFGQDLQVDQSELDIHSYMTLPLKVSLLNFAIIGYNFVIFEWIVFILGHNNPLDKTFK